MATRAQTVGAADPNRVGLDKPIRSVATLTPADVAELCGVDRATVSRWLKRRLIAAQGRTPSGRWRFTPEGAAAVARRMAAAAAA